jgi:hypothetical protein
MNAPDRALTVMEHNQVEGLRRAALEVGGEAVSEYSMGLLIGY